MIVVCEMVLARTHMLDAEELLDRASQRVIILRLVQQEHVVREQKFHGNGSLLASQ